MPAKGSGTLVKRAGSGLSKGGFPQRSMDSPKGKPETQSRSVEQRSENVQIKPVTLQFLNPELEATYAVKHKAKYVHLVKTMLKVCLFMVVLTTIRPVQKKFIAVLVMKGLTFALILFLMLAFNKVFYNDALLAPLVLVGMILMLFSRVYREDSEGNIFFGAREADIGFVYLLFCGGAFFFGLRF